MLSGYQLDFTSVLPYIDSFEHGLVTTALLSLLTILISFVAAAVLVALRIAPTRWGRLPVRIYVDLMRNTPTLVLLYILYFGLSQSGLRLSPFTAALIALTLHSTAFTIEIYRGGILAISPGQREASDALNLGTFSQWRYVILPQAIRHAYPALGNQVVGVVLSTSLVSAISLQDVTFAAYTDGSITFRYLEAFIVAIVVYIVIVQIINGAWKLTGRLLFNRKLA